MHKDDLIMYTFVIPLTHNAFELYSDSKTVSELYEIKGEYSIQNKYDALRVYTIDKTTFCEISLFANNEAEARAIAKTKVNILCNELSLLFNCKNENLHSHQPRIEADWTKVQIEISETKSIRSKQGEADAFEISGIDPVEFADSVSLMLCTEISADSINLKWHENETMLFLMEELYIALGTENEKSKYMHLYSIVEFCEEHEELKKHSNAKKVFFKNDGKRIREFAQRELNKSDQEVAKIDLGRIYNLDRAQIQMNILKWMGITQYSYKGKNYKIDNVFFDRLRKTRNAIAHGRNTESRLVKELVSKLLDITIQIIIFLRNNMNVLES